MEEQVSFNLVDEPWIRVRDGASAEQELSILELFRQAPRLKCLATDAGFCHTTFAACHLAALNFSCA